MWWKAGIPELGRMSDRISSIYLDRCEIDRTQNSIRVATEHRAVHIPAAMVASILLGPGTTITHGAMNLLADSGTAVAWVGQSGVRLYASGTSTSSSSHVIERQAWLVSRPHERIKIARAMYLTRFPGEPVTSLTMQQLLGKEGSRVKKLYREHSQRTGVAWTGRKYVPGHAMAAGDDVNRLLSAGNTALYGICHAAIVGVGASPALGFIHTGSANSFVLDIADLYKHHTTIPAAFNLAAAGKTSERDARTSFRDAVAKTGLMDRIITDIMRLIGTSEQTAAIQTHSLWNGNEIVPSGINYSDDGTIARKVDTDQ